MKTLADCGVLDATVARLRTLSADSTPLWGAMSAGQVVSHVDDAFRMAVGALYVYHRLLPFAPIVRLAVLYSGVPWAKNLPTVAELDLVRRPDALEQLSVTRGRLVERMRAFSTLAPDALLPAHPMLGPMTHWEWMRWGYLHTDHHLQQFGC